MSNDACVLEIPQIAERLSDRFRLLSSGEQARRTHRRGREQPRRRERGSASSEDVASCAGGLHDGTKMT